MELILLALAPTSAIAGLWFWQDEQGRFVWKYLGVLVAILAVVKPLLNLTKRIRDYEAVLSGYRTLEYDLREIRTLIEQRSKYDAGLREEFQKAIQREKALVAKTPETREVAKVKSRCEEEVRREFPENRFFIPEE